jgi:hypothetical protein
VDIAEVARRSGIPASALRYYEEKRLIASVGRRVLGVPDVSPVAPGGRVRRPGRAHTYAAHPENFNEGRHRLRAIPAANGPVVNEHHEVDRGAATVAKVTLDMTAGVAGLRRTSVPATRFGAPLVVQRAVRRIGKICARVAAHDAGPMGQIGLHDERGRMSGGRVTDAMALARG